MKRRALALLCAGILAVGMLAGCGGSSDKKDSSAKTEDTKKEAKSDGTFTFALNYMPNSLQPSAQSSDDLVSAIRPIYEPLFAETKDGLNIIWLISLIFQKMVLPTHFILMTRQHGVMENRLQ